MNNFFAKSFCVNLDSLPANWEAFQKRISACPWPFVEPERFSAIDGKNVPFPAHHSQGSGSWGCARSHISIIEKCLNEKVESVLILEDDAELVDGFVEKCETFLANVPKDWGMIYLGGQLLDAANHPPLLVNDHVAVPWNVNRTHAYAVHARAMKQVYKHLLKKDWVPRHHIDHHYGLLHQSRQIPVYIPREWLVWQAEGFSRISHQKLERRQWTVDPNKFTPNDGSLPWAKPPFFAILGLHSSGSSAIAGACYHLGMHLGDKLAGFYGTDPEKSCGFEARGLARICEMAAPFPQPSIRLGDGLKKEFDNWLAYSWRRAIHKKTVAGGKYPTLCAMGDWLTESCGDGLRIINCVRPPQDSIKSLAKRGGRPTCTPGQASAVQSWLHSCRQSLLDGFPVERRLDVDFYDLLTNTDAVVGRIAAFMGTDPTPSQIERAVESVKPEKRHV